MLSGLEEPTDSLLICNRDCMDPKVIVVFVSHVVWGPIWPDACTSLPGSIFRWALDEIIEGLLVGGG